MEVMLNPPKKAKKPKAKGSKKKSSAHKKKRRVAKRHCMPKRLLRRAKSLKRLKSMVFKPGKRVCFPKSALAHADSLKKFKHRYAGVKYGFARHKKSAKGAMVQGELDFGPPPKKSKTKKGKKSKPVSVKYTYMDIINLSPFEREARGITEKHIQIAGKRGEVMVRPPVESAASEEPTYDWKEQTSVYGGVPTAANPYRRKYRFNYTVPVYAFNDELSMAGLRDGITAGYRPRVLMQVVPVVGGLVANGIVSGMLTKMVAERLKLSDTTKGPAGLAIGLATAGALSMATKMVAPRYAQSVFLGGLAQVLWDGYNTYLSPLVKKTLGLGRCQGIGCSDEEPDLSFGLYCPECADGLNNTLNDFLTPAQVQFAQPVISEAVAAAMPAMDAAMQAPPTPSAPLTAKVNGKEVIVEKVINQPSGTSGFGDFLTPNQVAQASPLGDFGSL